MKKYFFLFALTCCTLISYSQSWKSFSDSADGFRKEEDYDKAIIYYFKAKDQLAKDSIYSFAFADLCKRIADTYLANDQGSEILKFYIKSKEEVEKKSGKENVSNANICDLIGLAYVNVSPVIGEKYLLEARDVRKTLFTDKSVEYAVSCNSLGGFYSTTGQYETSLAYHTQAKEIRSNKLGTNHPLYAQSCNNMGVCYWYMGEYEKAEQLALEAKAIRQMMYEQNKDPQWSYAITCANLGNIYRDMGQYEKAEVYYKISKQIRQEHLAPEHPSNIAIINSLADLYAYMGRYQDAEPLYKEAQALIDSTAGKESSSYALNCNNLADMYSAMGRYKEAESLFLEAKNIWAHTLKKKDATIALNLNSLGVLYYNMGDLTKAELYLNEARSLWDTVFGKSHPYYSKNIYNLAKVYWNKGQIAKARDLYASAFKMEYAQLNKFFRFTNETEKQQYLENIRSSADENLSFSYKNQSASSAAYAYDVAVSNKALILASSTELRKLVFESGNETLKSQFESWSAIKQRIANLYMNAKGSEGAKLKDLEKKADSIEAILSRTSSAFREKNNHAKDWKAVQKILKPDEAAIEFSQFNYFNGKEWTDSTLYVAIIIKKESAQPQIITLFEKKQLDSLLGQKQMQAEQISAAYTRGIKKGNSLLSGQKLYELVWKPLEKSLKNVKRIYYAPTSQLHRISISALPFTKDSSLIDRYDLQMLTSTAIINKLDQQTKPIGKLSVYGGINYGKSAEGDAPFPYLQGTADEMNDINKLASTYHININSTGNYQATESSLQLLNGKSSPSVLHIATHGYFFEGTPDSSAVNHNNEKLFLRNDNPLLRTGLAFANANQYWNANTTDKSEDGIVTAYEISNMYLPNTQLVVLSACETALGDIQSNEGVFGLQRAFKMAGANYLLMSLWEVPDRETAQFMKMFYQNLFKGKAVPDAFRGAQLKMRADNRNEPDKWAAWILMR